MRQFALQSYTSTTSLNTVPITLARPEHAKRINFPTLLDPSTWDKVYMIDQHFTVQTGTAPTNTSFHVKPLMQAKLKTTLVPQRSPLIAVKF